MSELSISRICGNCDKFCPIGSMKAADAKTNKLVAAGQRNCSAQDVDWADSPCTTGEFVAKDEVKKD